MTSYRFPYDTLPRRNRTGERHLYLDIEEANRRDARDAGEFTSPPGSRSDARRTAA